MHATLEQLAQLAGATLQGEPSTAIRGVAGVHNARPGEIALLAERRYARFVDTTQASALVVGPDFDAESTDLPLLVADDPGAAFQAIADRLCPPLRTHPPGIHPTAQVAEDAEVGPGASIQAYCVVESGARVGRDTVLRPFVFVGAGAEVGAECLLHPHAVVLDRCSLGDRVVLHGGVVVGGDGYGFETRDGAHHKVPQRGIVEVGDDVEIGANTTIDRARYGRTVIGSGTKIDNLVMVAHNCVVGEHCLLVAQSGIAGSTTLGHHVVAAAQAGIVGHVTIGEGTVIAAQTGVAKSTGPGETVFGSPAQDIRTERRCIAQYKKLPQLAARLRQLEQTVERLTQEVQRREGAAEDHPQEG
ncbi:MAG: UDP-3-O-(3-hydroxymyristoyl)glucosamine N-acyltransferase [Candidatus Brocadiia bacterium]